MAETFLDSVETVPVSQNAAPRAFHAMAKPVSSTCNLDCTYCYYLSKENLPGGPATGKMSDEMLELFVQQYIAGQNGPEVIFSWQGGEPTLLGLEFFRKVVAFEKNMRVPVKKFKTICKPTERCSMTSGANF